MKAYKTVVNIRTCTFNVFYVKLKYSVHFNSVTFYAKGYNGIKS